MATVSAHPHSNKTALSNIFASLKDTLAGYQQSIRWARTFHAEYSRVYNELDALSDRELADIGIHRANIESVAREAGRNVAG